jgi:hypothetical protein
MMAANLVRLEVGANEDREEENAAVEKHDLNSGR